MYEVVFRCKHCEARLSASADDAGYVFDCPSCDASTAVPVGDILFACPKCRVNLLASKDSIGETFGCPRCENLVIVPSQGKMILIPNHQAVDSNGTTSLSPPDSARHPEERSSKTSNGRITPEERQFMTTWGDYLAKAGLTGEEKPDTHETK